MKLSPLGLAILCFMEEFRAEAYPDPGGVWTVGYGETGPDVRAGVTRTPLEAAQWMGHRVAENESAIDAHVKRPLTQGQFDSLVLFSYNIGMPRFLSSTLLQYLNAQDDADASLQFARWDKVRGVESEGLERRRAIEKALFNS